MSKRLTIALAGNPNCGKTSIFNAMTGARQHVGNYPGVTVEKKEGTVSCKGHTIHVVDLPGTYSLTAFSIEEVIARQFVVEEKPDLVVNVIDGSSLERNLYLTVQLLELRVPMVVALNMTDELERKGIRIDYAAFEEALGCPVCPTVGHKGGGVDKLLQTIVEVAEKREKNPLANEQHGVPLHLGDDVDGEVLRLAGLLEQCGAKTKVSPSWTALKLLENDSEVRKQVGEWSEAERILEQTERSVKHLRTLFGDDPEMVIAEKRYGIVSGLHRKVARSTVEHSVDISEKIDRVLTNRAIGLPIFALFMYVTFWLVFTVGAVPMGWIESAFGWLGEVVSHLWPRGSESPLKSLIVDGLIGGVGGVIVFIPNILLLFFAIAALEYSGYMARAAFLMDRVMKWSGFHGKSFIPMLTGFGCTVPAIMGTRCLDNQRDRLITILVLPLISCGARFPIYALIIPAFFPPAYRANVLYGIYVLGILLAILLAKLLRTTLFRGEPSPFVMELPPYRIPTLKAISIYMWERARLYLNKAGTIILSVSIVLWALAQYPAKEKFDRDYDKLANEARAEYLGAVDAIDAALGVNGQPLRTLSEARLKFDEEQGRFWEHEAPYRAAVKAREGVEEALVKRDARLTLFIAETDGSDENDIKASSGLDVTALLSQYKEAQDVYAEKITQLENDRAQEALRYSCVGRLGTAMEKAFSPAGFDWKVCSALVGALAAKEVFVSQLSIIYSMGNADTGNYSDVKAGQIDGLGAALRNDVYPSGDKRAGEKTIPPLVAICILLFCLISAPCMATIAVTVRETNSWKWGLLQFAGLTVLGWSVAVVVYQVGLRLGIGV